MRTSRVTGAALIAQIEAGAAPAIVDVRSRWEFARGHVPGATHIPFWLMPARVVEVPASRAQPVVLYCGHGPRAFMAGAVLRATGFRQVLYLEGHMRGWRQARLREEIGPRVSSG